MAETLLEKANRLGIKPAAAQQPGIPFAPQRTETLAEKAARLGIKPANATPMQKIGSSIKESISERADKFNEARDRTQAGEQTGAELALQTIGQGIGGLTDIALSPLAAVPDSVKEAIPNSAQAIGDAYRSTPEGFRRGLETAFPIIPATRTALNFAGKAANAYDELPERAKANIGAVADIASLIPAERVIGAGAKMFGKTATKAAGLGADALKVGSDVGAGATKATKGAVSNLVKPESILSRVYKVNPTETQKFRKMTGMSHQDWAVQNDIFGTPDEAVEQAWKKFSESKTAADKGLESVQGSFAPKPLGTALDDLIAREAKVTTPGTETSEFYRIHQLKNKFDSQGLTMPEMNEVKRLYEKVKTDYVKEVKSAEVERANRIDDAIRDFQFKEAENQGFTNLTELNKDTQAAYQFANDLWKTYTKDEMASKIGLRDAILLSGGTPSSIAMSLANKIFSSKFLMSRAARAGSRIRGDVYKKTAAPLFKKKTN